MIEYEFQGYTPPTDAEAFYIATIVMHSNGPQVKSSNLLFARQELEEHDLTQHGAHQLKRQNRGRYHPRWREVWQGEPQ